MNQQYNGFLASILPQIDDHNLISQYRDLFFETSWIGHFRSQNELKFIFGRKGELLASDKGYVIKAGWNYLKSLNNYHLKIGGKEYLVNMVFINTKLLIFKMDRGDDYILLTNEQISKNFNPYKYLGDLRLNKFKIATIRLANNKILEVHNVGRKLDLSPFLLIRHKVTFTNGQQIPKGNYVSQQFPIPIQFVIESGRIKKIFGYSNYSVKTSSKSGFNQLVIKQSSFDFIKGDKVLFPDYKRLIPDGEYIIQDKKYKIEVVSGRIERVKKFYGIWGVGDYF